MTFDRILPALMWAYVVAILVFILAPIATSFVISFNSDRFPTLPLGGFSLQWYQAIWDDPTLAPAIRNTIVVGLAVSVISTVLGLTAAYADYRYRFMGKSLYLALALLPPTIPVIILGLAMLIFLSRVGLFGQIHSVIISHVVICLPFAMALIRLRLSQMDPNLEAAAWNLGAGEWRAIREIILPFTMPAILSALFITMAVSFDEYAVAWFVSGFSETLPVRILASLQGQVSPRINAIGSLVFTVSIVLVIVAQCLLLLRSPGGTGRAPVPRGRVDGE